ncbi:hypothetical protein BDF20DRAFT_879024, partial [Mycotypha africana]|uniref:uncharacterized protein n=1 Tax=Mycotypha africana TaxID=64632 RepID=UPI0023018424
MTIHNHTLTLQDFSHDEVQDNFRPAFLDPGRRSEYYHMTRSTRHAAKLEKKKAGTIKMIESGIPTAKNFYHQTT